MLAQGNLRFGPYRLTSVLGHGGMAEVSRALTLAADGTAATLAVKRRALACVHALRDEDGRIDGERR